MDLLSDLFRCTAETSSVFGTRLPFGAASSVSSCVRVTNCPDLIRERVSNLCVDVCAYIDDFGVVGGERVVSQAVSMLRHVLKVIGCRRTQPSSTPLLQKAVSGTSL